MFIRGDWFFVLLSLLATAFMTKPYIYVIQQDNYRLKGLFKSKTIRSAFLVDLVAMLVFLAIFTLASFLHSRAFWGFLIAMFFFITEIILYFAEDGDKKKPLKYTKRAVRGFALVIVVGTAITALIFFHLSGIFDDDDAFFRYVAILLFPIVYPLIFLITMSIVNFFEGINNLRYEKKTKKQLNKGEVLKIAITGSFGKTSVKNFLKALLDVRYKVLATPESYNTPMGIAKTVKGLDVSHQIFIAEMGARRKGDIKRLMSIVDPDIAILTGINAQHLETFKTKENIIAEKTQILKLLKDEGKAFVNGNLKSLIEEERGCFNGDISFVGTEADEVYASDITIGQGGSVFKLHFGECVYDVTTMLIGRHNVENLAVASAVAYSLGVLPKHIVERIATIEPVPHRLQLISGDVVNIIDDTFNGNPDGARIALETLGCFSGRKVVVTPGLVELGVKECEENKIFGEHIARVADVVALVGGCRTKYVRSGMKEFHGEILHFATLEEAQKSFKDFIHIGDTVLLLNDLPDIYED